MNAHSLFEVMLQAFCNDVKQGMSFAKRTAMTDVKVMMSHHCHGNKLCTWRQLQLDQVSRSKISEGRCTVKLT
jgi:hypothetical protein